MKITFLLPTAILLGIVQSFFDVPEMIIHDLTTKSGRNKIEREGFNLNSTPYLVHFKVSTDYSLASQGYIWIVDGNRCGGILHSKSATPVFVADGQGEEVFTLTAYSFGECTYRIAFANPNQFTGFDEYEGGDVISIPINISSTQQTE